MRIAVILQPSIAFLAVVCFGVFIDFPFARALLPLKSFRVIRSLTKTTATARTTGSSASTRISTAISALLSPRPSPSESVQNGDTSLPRQLGGSIVPYDRKSRSKTRFSLVEWQENLQKFLMNVELPEEISQFNISSLTDNIGTIWERNVVGQTQQGGLSAEPRSRGEIYVVIQMALLYVIVTGEIPIIGGVLNFVFGPLLTCSGLLVAALTAIRMGPGLSPWPVPNDSTALLTTGFYSYVRHPMYGGLLAACAGFSFWTGSAIRFVFTLVLWFALSQKARYEELALLEKFGSKYSQYQDDVPHKFIPGEKTVSDALPTWLNGKDHDVTMY